jgi:type II secretion system protein G
MERKKLALGRQRGCAGSPMDYKREQALRRERILCLAAGIRQNGREVGAALKARPLNGGRLDFSLTRRLGFPEGLEAMSIETQSQLARDRGNVSPKRAFTLVELLIVVAIIAILAAAATPSLLEACVRAKAARVRSDLRTIQLALEAYAVDAGKYPYIADTFEPLSVRLSKLTTPVAYLSEFPTDPFRRKAGTHLGQGDPLDPLGNHYLYNTGHSENGASSSNPYDPRRSVWSLTSGGPDEEIIFPYYAFGSGYLTSRAYLRFLYDPTNGTSSPGEIFIRGGASRYPIPEVDSN